MSNFQIALITTFVIFTVVAVLIFTGAVPGFKAPEGGYGGEVVVWGTFPKLKLSSATDAFNQQNKALFTIRYEEKSKDSFERELLEALASGKGPDIFFLTQDMVLKHKDKVLVVPFETITEREFKDTFTEEGELYLTPEGTLALPLSVDPLVMYWNRDIFSSAAIARPPEFWDEFLTIAPAVTKRDDAGNVLTSAISFGEFENVTHAKDILSMLILQAGNNIVEVGEDGRVNIVLSNTQESGSQRTESALRFYTEFSNPVKPAYSWNRSLPESRDMFVGGDLAVYFGYASELPDIITKNPHLNFDVSLVPQIRDNKIKETFGNMYALAIARNTGKPQTAFQALVLMAGSDFASAVSKALKLPPVRRDLLSIKQTDAYNSVFYDSALRASAWLDPNPEASYNVFKDMVEDVSSGRFRISQAVLNANTELKQSTDSRE